MTTRRRFLQVGGALAATGSVACSDIPPELAKWIETPEGPAPTPDFDDVDLVSHVISRLSFGARPRDYARVRAGHADMSLAVERYVTEQLAAETIADQDIARRLARFAELHGSAADLYEYKEKVLLADLTSAALLRARYSERQLQEVMTDFWSDHLNIDSSKGDCRWLKAADDRDVIRAHALGSFPALLRASATSPAMLWYLDGRMNRRASPGERPNENYARELLELHTLGVHGGYTQADVMEVARALSGWSVRSRHEVVFGLGKVEFLPELHDDGEKHILGQSLPPGGGARDLDAVIELTARHPATARHIATKLCRRFIDDDPPVAALGRVAETFVATRGSIRSSLHTLFQTPEFLNARRTKLKRPFHFVVSALRATGARTDGGPALHEFLQRMGHAPYQFPTPDGYADDQASWLGTLLWRWNFAAALSGDRIAGTRIPHEELLRVVGGREKLPVHLLGRRPTSQEDQAVRLATDQLAVWLASPAFQRY
ncbi:MAG: DUF1800 domain-containing protein [Gemmatimonadaceae bacterium]